MMPTGDQDPAATDGTAGRPSARRLLRLLPLAGLLAGLALFLALGLDETLSLDLLARHRESLTETVAARPVLAALGYVAAYALAIALSLPVGALSTIAGGFLFGVALGTVLTVVGATLGAAAVFLAARTALAGPLRRRAGPFLSRLERGFQENALSYLLALRLVPVLPFWLVNLVPALLGVRLSTFVVATAIGIVPATAVFAGVGDGLGAVLEAGGTADLGLILEPRVLWPLVGLALLVLMPVLWRRFGVGAGTS